MNSSSEEPEDAGTETRSSGRRLVVAGIVVLCLVLGAGGLFAYLGSRVSGGEGDSATEVTFGPEGDATSIPAPPPNFGPLTQLSQDSGPAGSVVTLQGVNFKAGKEFRPVEIYWDRSEGMPLKTAEGPRFSVQLTIPADAPVLTEGHNVLMVQKEKGGKVVLTTSLPFFVLKPR